MTSILELLPISPNAILKTSQDKLKFLETYRYFIQCGIDAFEAFLAGDLQKFDAHVGDTSCQIRAYQIFTLHHFEKIKNLNDSISRLKALFQRATLDSSSLENKKEFTDIITVLDRYKLHFELTEEEVLLFQTFFLTKITLVDAVKVFGRIKLDELLAIIPNASRNFIEKIVANFQRDISENSCRFVCSLLKELDGYADFEKISLECIKNDELNRSVIPAFISGTAIFQHMLKNKIGVRLIGFVKGTNDSVLKELPLHYKVNEEGSDFILDENPDFSSPHFIVKGEAQNISSTDALALNINSHGLIKVLLGAMAYHAQYGGKKLELVAKDFFTTLYQKYSDSSISIKKLYFSFTEMYQFSLSYCKQELPALLVRHIFSAKLNTLIA